VCIALSFSLYCSVCYSEPAACLLVEVSVSISVAMSVSTSLSMSIFVSAQNFHV